MRSVCLLVNDAAGRGGARQAAIAAEHRLREHGCAVRRQVGDAVPAGDILAVVGGDGTVHRALPSVAGTGTTLGLIPAGSGNDLATALGIPADPRAAADLIAAGPVRTIDLAGTGGRWWATVLCAGFDSAVAARANRVRWPAGPRRYDLALLVELLRLRPYPFTLTLDGVLRQQEVTSWSPSATPRCTAAACGSAPKRSWTTGCSRSLWSALSVAGNCSGWRRTCAPVTTWTIRR